MVYSRSYTGLVSLFLLLFMSWPLAGCAQQTELHDDSAAPAASPTVLYDSGTWAATATLSGAVIARGQLRVESNKQVVQHPDGGVVGKINVQDGDIVEAGEVLCRLDPGDRDGPGPADRGVRIGVRGGRRRRRPRPASGRGGPRSLPLTTSRLRRRSPHPRCDRRVASPRFMVSADR